MLLEMTALYGPVEWMSILEAQPLIKPVRLMSGR